MSDAEYVILTILKDGEPLRIHDIQKTFEHRWGPVMYATITNTLTRLQKHDWITKRDCTTDPRFKVYKITEQGEDVRMHRFNQLNHLVTL